MVVNLLKQTEKLYLTIDMPQRFRYNLCYEKARGHRAAAKTGGV